MTLKKTALLILVGGALSLLSLAWLLPARQASAQCGTTPSTCKTCHEVQAQMPVNTLGAWHVQHAAFDFCANCHGGDKLAKDAAAAHAGVVVNLADMGNNCQACHANDLDQRYAVYAAALGTAGTPAATGPAPTSAVGAFIGSPSAGPQPGSPAQPAPNPLNRGNVALAAIIAALLLGGGGYIYWNERRLRVHPPARSEEGKAMETARPITYEELKALPPDVLAIIPQIARMTPEGRQALKELLDDPQRASELILRLSFLDLELLSKLRRMDREDRALMLALAGDDTLEV